jgi:hypothetical protein
MVRYNESHRKSSGKKRSFADPRRDFIVSRRLRPVLEAALSGISKATGRMVGTLLGSNERATREKA